jgi:hypothetical protein
MTDYSSEEFLQAMIVFAIRSKYAGHPLLVNNNLSPTKTPCHNCRHSRSIPYNAHILCAKPDLEMSGHPTGVERSWFMYPLNFDPVWRTKDCSNYQSISIEGNAVSSAVSEVVV